MGLQLLPLLLQLGSLAFGSSQTDTLRTTPVSSENNFCSVLHTNTNTVLYMQQRQCTKCTCLGKLHVNNSQAFTLRLRSVPKISSTSEEINDAREHAGKIRLIDIDWQSCAFTQLYTIWDVLTIYSKPNRAKPCTSVIGGHYTTLYHSIWVVSWTPCVCICLWKQIQQFFL